MKKSNNSSFVLLIFEILKYQSLYICLFQMLTPTPFQQNICLTNVNDLSEIRNFE